jgi:hypothetical protein
VPLRRRGSTGSHGRTSEAPPDERGGCADRRLAGRLGFNPKKSGPDHGVPVIVLPETTAMTVFPNGKHDDQVDSTAQFLDWFKKPFPGQGIFEYYRRLAEKAEQRPQPRPAHTAPQPGCMEWFADKKTANKSPPQVRVLACGGNSRVSARRA